MPPLGVPPPGTVKGIPTNAAIAAGAALALLGLAASAAQQRDNQAFDALLRRYDADFDGRISRAEYPRSAAVFRRLDKDKDGFLTAADFGGAKPQAGAPTADAADPSLSMTSEQTEFFESKVRPLLAGSCYRCHSATAEKLRGEFRLDSREALLVGGPSGPALVPGSPDDSLLVRAVRYTDEDLQMPPKERLEPAQVAILEEWVRQGAPWPRAASTAGAEVAVTSAKQEYDFDKAREHWAFRPVEKRAPPATKRGDWAETEIDGFLLAAMEQRGVAPVADADKRTWLRRVTLDLTGLPPTPEELDAFEADKSKDARERVVDRLLASSAYGERFGRHWLDVARYAESSGKDVNIAYPHAWRYRDYVIDAFNSDKRYDEFLTEQLAGDLLPAANADERAEHAVATGYLALGPKGHNTRDRRQFALDVADEQLDAVSQGMLGMTIACARCHDHKFDAIPTEDYYSLAGIFVSTDTRYGTYKSQGNDHPSALVALPADADVSAGPRLTALAQTAIERIRDQIERRAEREAKEAERDAMTGDGKQDPAELARVRRIEQQTEVLDHLLARFDADGASNANNRVAMGAVDGGARDIAVLQRGELDKPGPVVPRGFLTLLGDCGAPKIVGGSGRRELAQWITAPSNPLTARVWANRVWSHLFGAGIVPTADNFGTSGQPPDHPELLDWLAATLVEDGWSTKKLVRRIVLSHAYRLAAVDAPAGLSRDPELVTLWRFPERRLEAEAIRDSMLAVSGRLDRARPVGSNVNFVEGPVRNDAVVNLLQETRPVRSIYLPIVRDQLPEALAVFDVADPLFVTGTREETNVATQALFLMNDPSVLDASDALAKALLAEIAEDDARIEQAFLRVLGRRPRSDEASAVKKFVASFEPAAKPSAGKDRKPRGKPAADAKGLEKRQQAWSAFVQTLFQTAEFRYLG
jgi:cytochrome c553